MAVPTCPGREGEHPTVPPRILPLLVLRPPGTAAGLSGAEAPERGCGGGCHPFDAPVPRLPEAERRTRIAALMERHPGHRAVAKPAVPDYLAERGRR